MHPVDIHALRIPPAGEPAPEDVALLSADERARATRYLRAIDRVRSVAARALLRRQLGACLGCDPAALVFASNHHGKPMLAQGPAFNVSHGGDWVLVAIAQAPVTDLGIDVEPIQALSDLPDVVARIATPAERQRIAAGPPAEFLRIWTRKEAVVKALGLGLSAPLADIDVLADRACVSGAPDGLVIDVELDARHRAAVAVRGTSTITLRLHRSGAAASSAPPPCGAR
jgi:4'-phosphopantetheinyl transferase